MQESTQKLTRWHCNRSAERLAPDEEEAGTASVPQVASALVALRVWGLQWPRNLQSHRPRKRTGVFNKTALI